VKVAIAKPEYGIRGGFEFVLDRVVQYLEVAGHDVSWITIEASEPEHSAFGLDIPDDVWVHSLEYFRYMAQLDRFGRLGSEAKHADVLLCTQPSSWAVPHDRKLALFYHHLRVFYDLADVYVAAGYTDPVFHDPCTVELRAADAPLLDGVRHFLVPSTEVAGRLDRFNEVSEVRRSLFLAGFAFRDGRGREPAPVEGKGYALCVSRHEWPKRTELAVAACHRLPDTSVVIVGGGGRLGHAKAVDVRLRSADLDLEDGEQLWLPARADRPPAGYRPSANLELLGHVSDDELDRLYAESLCVIAPAYLEDYGLTAVEAMAYGKPVIVCRDGGGLVDTVTDGVNGFVVEPTGKAIAEAVDRLRQDPGLAASLSDGALAAAAEYTWSRAMRQLTEGLERAAS